MNRRTFVKRLAGIFAASVCPQIIVSTFGSIVPARPKLWTPLNKNIRSYELGTFDKWIYPVISNMSKHDIIDQILAVQPLGSPVGLTHRVASIFKNPTPGSKPFRPTLLEAAAASGQKIGKWCPDSTGIFGSYR